MPGARYLWPLRAATLVLVLALLFDPPLPWDGAGGPEQRWVLLDASLSMAAGAEPSASPWATALQRAEDLRSEGWRVVTFGLGIGAADSLPAMPVETGTRLAPALVRAAEGGAREIRVLSDLRIEDAVAVRAAIERLGAAVTFETMGEPVANAGIAALDVEDRVDPGAVGVARVEVHGGQAGDSLGIAIAEEGTIVATGGTEAPGPGLRRTLEIPLPAATGAGIRRFEARLSGSSDAFSPDDGAVTYARVGSVEEGGVVLVSLAPDWEPRALLPVLTRTTGLPGAGYLRVGADRYVPMGRAVDRSGPVDSATVRAAAEGAGLLVLHGLGQETEAWARTLAERAPRLLAFALDAGGAELLGIATSAPRTGEWYVTEEAPPSPLAGALQALDPVGLPPLGGMLAVPDPAGTIVPLTARLRGTGPAEAPLRLRTVGARREALVLARGFWRWAARPGGADAYEALWAGVAGWLLREPAAAGAEVRPAARVVPRGERVSWLVPEDREGGRVLIRPDSVGGAPGVATGGTETLLSGPGTVHSAPLPPGLYRYTVLDVDGDSVSAGRFDVAEGTSDMLPEPMDPPDLTGSAGGLTTGGGEGRPLRTSPWPYLLILALLSAEWIGRRRSGLR